MSTIMNISLSRRQFLGLGAAAGASVFLLGVALPTGCARVEQAGPDQDLNAFIGIDDKGQ
ncbi:MAG: twin-arginine translocation signal domain-containing protein, partial [Gammaproteobacteria bacterium]